MEWARLQLTADIIRSGSYAKREELMRLRAKCQKDNASPYFDDLEFITKTTVTEAIKLLFSTTRAGLHPHWISSDEEEEQEVPNREQAMEQEENNLYLPD